ncbi:MAG: carotenoid 1,2-hydratase [Shewanella sp.]|nr:carotenoid 1,2-hydratase [Shewanella sp.]
MFKPVLDLLSLSLAALLLTACEPVPSLENSQGMGKLMGSDQADIERYSKVLPETRLSFPEDHRAHEDFRQEWWYLTANLETLNGEPMGLQWTQFRIAVTPESGLPKLGADNSWATGQLYMAHSAVTTRTEHLAAELWSRGNPELAGVETSPLRIYLDNWQWQSRSRDLFPAVLEGGGADFSYRLKLGSHAPYQLQGKQGFSIKSADGAVASHYYSQPFISIKGEVTVRGKVHQVRGNGWLDREWSSQFLTGSQQGWDWFALRLGEHKGQEAALMLFQLRGGGDPSSNPETSHFFSGRLMYKDGTGHSISPDEIQIQAQETYITKGKKIPVKWRLQVPKEQIDVTVSALNPDALMPLTIQYWEGPVLISGSHQGTGYMELTGY